MSKLKAAVLASLVAAGLFLSVGKSASVPAGDKTRSSENFTPAVEPINSPPQVLLKEIVLTKTNHIVLNTQVDGQSANSVIEAIRKANKENTVKRLYLLLDSPGGSVIDGGRIISEMQASRIPIDTVCLGVCASMAAMILEYGQERNMVDRSIVMFHPASIQLMERDDLDRIYNFLGVLRRYVDKMDHHTASRMGVTYEAFKLRTSQNLWLDAEDALRDKIIDNVVKVDYQSVGNIDSGENEVRDMINLLDL